MAKQLEKKSTQNKEKQAATSSIEHETQTPELLNLITKEDAESGIFNDPRLQYSNAGDLRLQTMQMLQQRGGNTQIQRIISNNTKTEDGASLIQREDSESHPVLSWLDTQRHNLMEAVGLETSEQAERGRATAFYAHGTYGPQTVIGAAGRGGFNVTYDPLSGIERIIIKGGVKFIDGLSVSGGTVTPGNPGLQGAATQATALTGARRAAFIAQYQWSATEKAPFVANLKSVVQNTWGSGATGLSFFINKPQWDWITARVVIDTRFRAMDATDTRADDDHLVINAYKEPPGTVEHGQGTGAEVRYGSGRSAFDQEMDISSQDIIGRLDNLLLRNNVVNFAHNRAELTEADKTRLRAWIRLYQGSPTSAGANPTQITIQGYTSASGTEEYNLNLGLRRTEAVRNFISREGFTNVDSRVMEISYGEAYASETSTEEQQRRERRVELIVDSGEAQIVAAHEFGHAFGLGDEYASGFGGPAAGTRAGHDTLVKNMTDESGGRLPGAIRENTDSIMSVGNVVRPQHYATFDKALKQVTGVSEWSIRS